MTATAAVESTAAAFSAADGEDAHAGAAGRDLGAASPESQASDRPRGQGGGRGAHRRARAVQQHPHGAVGDAEVGADLAVPAALDGDAEQRLALLERQRRDAVERAAHVVAALDLGVDVAERRCVVEQLDVARRSRA